jgi:hypothetical protein
MRDGRWASPGTSRLLPSGRLALTPALSRWAVCTAATRGIIVRSFDTLSGSTCGSEFDLKQEAEEK